VTSAADEKGRRTVFDALPDTMPRVMSIGRLDLNSEGLLL
jgi:23S rRNA pseudouridine2605 synthase